MSDQDLIRGMSSLVNIEKIKPGTDLTALENELISGDYLDGPIPVAEANLDNELLNITKIFDDTEIDQSKLPEPIDPYMRQLTMEQHKKQHVSSVLGPSTANSFSLDHEKKEDKKFAMLSDIDQLIGILQDDPDVDLSRIPMVDQRSSYEDVELTLRILRQKNDASRCCIVAEELMMAGAYFLEDIFDGEKEYFGKYKPDMRGYRNNMRVKLKRMRFDTNQVVASVTDSYSFGPLVRIFCELVPNAIMYCRNKSSQKTMDNVYSYDYSDATAKIRDL